MDADEVLLRVEPEAYDDDPEVSPEEKIRFADLLVAVMLRCHGVLTIKLNEHLLYGGFTSAVDHAYEVKGDFIPTEQAVVINTLGTVAEVVGWLEAPLGKTVAVRATLTDALAAFLEKTNGVTV